MSTGKVKLSFNEESSLIDLTFSGPGESDAEHLKMAQETEEFYKNLTERFPDKHFRVLVDLTNAGVPTKEASDIYIRTLSDKRIEKAAIFGMGGAIKSVINLIVMAAGRDEHTHFFVDSAQALAWLEKDI